MCGLDADFEVEPIDLDAGTNRHGEASIHYVLLFLNVDYQISTASANATLFD